MSLKLPENIEYCIEIMAGYTEPPVIPKVKGIRIGSYIKLARYDVNFINNVSSFISNKQGMTSRQRELAVKLTDKYRKQFRRIGIDVTQIAKEPVFSQAERKVDRTKKMTMDEDFIYLKFPYNQDMIKDVNTFLRDEKLFHNGTSRWVPEEKVWYINNNESNFVMLYNWSYNNGFEISEEIEQYQKEIRKILDNRLKYIPYAKITESELCNESFLTLVNAPESLQEYWDNNIKGQSVLSQIKNCGLLGIELDKDVLTKYNFTTIERTILENNRVVVDHDCATIIFACLGLGYEKIAVGMSSHSQSNVKEVEKIVRMYKNKFGSAKGLCINGKSSAFDNVTDDVVEKPDKDTKVLITDRMSRLQNTDWNFVADVTIGQGMFSKRNVWMSNKVIETRPQSDEEKIIDSDELF
ncbi:MAG: hypothetical protein CMA64_09600 [Euryarchaeota archaeon]|jgi:hypothetical protein|nr:hypothetical protein [Euryarchaeota archaeon]